MKQVLGSWPLVQFCQAALGQGSSVLKPVHLTTLLAVGLR